MHNNTKYIQDIAFEQIKAMTKQTLERLDSFDRQFSGSAQIYVEVSA